MQFITTSVDKVFTFIPESSGREYLQAPADASMELFGILNGDPAMWVLELLAVIEMTVIPMLMSAAGMLVSYDALSSADMKLFVSQ